MVQQEIIDYLDGIKKGNEFTISSKHRVAHAKNFDEWIELIKARAKEASLIGEENRNAYMRLRELVRENRLMPDDCRYIYSWLEDNYFAGTSDPFLLMEFAEMILPIYENGDDLDQRIFLYTCLGYSYLEASRTGDELAKSKAVSWYRKVTGMRYFFEDFKDDRSRVLIFVAYCNLIRICPELDLITPEETYSVWKELQELRNDELFCSYDERIPRIPELVRYTLEDFRVYCPKYLEKMRPGTKVYRELLEETEKYYASIENNNTTETDDPAYFYHFYSARVQRGEMSWTEAYYAFEKSYREYEIPVDASDFDPIVWFLNPLELLLDMLGKTDLPSKEKKKKGMELRKELVERLRGYSDVDSYSLSETLANFCFDKAILATMDTKDEKESFVLDLIVSRHINTYLHSMMVSILATRITQEAVEVCPEVFVGFPGMKDVADVRAGKMILCHYAQKTGLLHDIGKNAIIDIVNTDIRPLTDYEFQILRCHPARGFTYLSQDEDFYTYRDVVLGHHKSYDSEKGYPYDCDTRSSPYKSMIDVISVCDSLDAATDWLGRNYHRAKTFSEVLRELNSGAGSRYAPKIVSLLNERKQLAMEIEELLLEGRIRIYREAYKKFFGVDESEKKDVIRGFSEADT